jgi:uncharacterized protein YggU (UPF0235/DUF167 family)
MYVKVRVTPGMRKEKITQIDDVTFEMVIKEPAERNLANKKIRTVLAEVYNVKEGNVRIVTGHHSPSKIFDVIRDE